MTKTSRPPATIWNESGWHSYYETRRNTTSHVYPSEWFFLKDLLAEGMSVLDIGCAVGGLASVLSEHLEHFSYTGVDISEEMVRRAKEKHPHHRFYVIQEADLSILADNAYDLVVCLGVLHLSRKWRELVSAAWTHTKQSFLMDLRENIGSTIEDESTSYFRVGNLLGTESTATLPYNVINTTEALATLIESCKGYAKLQHYGYLAPASAAAITPAKNVLMNTYRIDRRL